MESSGVGQEIGGSGSESDGPGAIRWACIMVAAVLGGLAGGCLTIPLWIVTPYWVFLTLPHLFSAIFASSMAYLVAGPTKTTLSRAMVRPLLAAVILALVNFPLFLGMVLGIASYDDLALPGGLLTHFVESVFLGLVAGMSVTWGEPAQRAKRPAFVATLLISILAIAVLLVIGPAVLPVTLDN